MSGFIHGVTPSGSGDAVVDCSKVMVTILKPVERALPLLMIRMFALRCVNAYSVITVLGNIPFEVAGYYSLVVFNPGNSS